MKDRNVVIGVDIGGTKISAALFLPNGDVLRKEIRLVASGKGSLVVELISDMIHGLVDFAKKNSYKVIAIGAGVPGIYNPIKKTVWAPNIPGWEDYPLLKDLTSCINDPAINIVIESDRSCYILGEAWKGCAQGCRDAIFIAVGTGIGAGIMSNGRVLTGHSGIAGAIGWMALDPPYKEKYDNCGNFEHYASGNGLARGAKEALCKPQRTSSLMDDVPLEEITSHEVFKAFERQDPVATQVINKAIGYWAMVLANLVSTFNPQKVIFGGGLFGPATQFLNRILEESRKWAQPLAIQEITLEASKLGADAGLVGAGYLALKAINKQTHGE